jgi:mono/diheme cytochrome c family protein
MALVSLSLIGSHRRALAVGSTQPSIDFVQQVQPILRDNCYACHGPDKQKGKLRLDSRELALQGGGSGPSIVPGHGRDSYLVKRIRGEGDEDRMPVKRDPLNDQQIALITRWIDQGANWPASASVANAAIAKHWAYEKPIRPELPKVQDTAWPRNPIDSFVLAEMEQHGLSPSPEADRVTLIRRLYLDLVGILPTPTEVDAFVADASPDAYEKLVDRLLASPHYGERWGRHWLDLARYADTNGYEKDRTRSIWPYRDWVINAINADMPFDEFTIEQIAGDMLPNPTPSQRIATGFHRNTMLNEEGGIDVEEFRFKNLIDRVQTTATTWMGTTLHCAQCHNHKYDPISQKEYYQFMALLNNADEPVMEIPSASVSAKRAEIQRKIDQIENNYEKDFPLPGPQMLWVSIAPTKATAKSGKLVIKEDKSVLAPGKPADTNVYTLQLQASGEPIEALRLEVLNDPSLPNKGPGRAANGNFVLTKISVSVSSAKATTRPAPIATASADFSQANFSAAEAIEGGAEKGWAIDDGSPTHKPHHAIFKFAKLIDAKEPVTLTVTLHQDFKEHSLGRFRLSLGYTMPPDPSHPTPTREQYVSQKQTEWEQSVAPHSFHWTVLDPVEYSRNYFGSISKLPDHSLLFTGDNYYRDEYRMKFRGEPTTKPTTITAIRMEVLPDPSLPKNGPGRDPDGGWLVSEFIAGIESKATTQPAPVKLQNATADIGNTPELTIDGKRDTNWTQFAGDGKPHEIVFQVKDPTRFDPTNLMSVDLTENYFQQENVGRLRISVTSDKGDIKATGLPADVEQAIATPLPQRTTEQLALLTRYFLETTPLLDAQHQQVAALHASMPGFTETLVMEERTVQRPTFIHHRGEFLQLAAQVQPNVPAMLPPLPANQPHNRLALARWLVSPENPLTARVVMNRTWGQYFGDGIVKTVADFGIMGDKPTNPQLLDWLATEFMRQHWSMKAMHRLIVTSATYRQSSRIPPTLMANDPSNQWLDRFPRQRVEAEIVRDVALSAGGLLNEKIGGPSVYPPQPAGVSEQGYTNMGWPESKGPDRYRRGMYTFFRRTTPYAQLMTFDGPTSEMVCARRIKSDTPLQALTVLNDKSFIEAAQGLARRVMIEGPTDDAGRVKLAFRLCLTRNPDTAELQMITAFYHAQLDQFRQQPEQAKAAAISSALPPPKNADIPELAAWTMVSRSLLNLDETITRN